MQAEHKYGAESLNRASFSDFCDVSVTKSVKLTANFSRSLR